MAKLQQMTRNPLNIRWNKGNNWMGQIGEYKGFVIFSEEFLAVRAVLKILRNYRNRGIKTIRDVITTWAPPTENNTANYVRYVANAIGCEVDSKLRYDLDVFNLVCAMWKIESGESANVATVIDAMDLYETFQDDLERKMNEDFMLYVKKHYVPDDRQEN